MKIGILTQPLRGDYPDNIIRDYFQFDSLRLSGTDIGDQAILDLPVSGISHAGSQQGKP